MSGTTVVITGNGIYNDREVRVLKELIEKHRKDGSVYCEYSKQYYHVDELFLHFGGCSDKKWSIDYAIIGDTVYCFNVLNAPAKYRNLDRYLVWIIYGALHLHKCVGVSYELIPIDDLPENVGISEILKNYSGEFRNMLFDFERVINKQYKLVRKTIFNFKHLVGGKQSDGRNKFIYELIRNHARIEKITELKRVMCKHIKYNRPSYSDTKNINEAEGILASRYIKLFKYESILEKVKKIDPIPFIMLCQKNVLDRLITNLEAKIEEIRYFEQLKELHVYYVDYKELFFIPTFKKDPFPDIPGFAILSEDDKTFVYVTGERIDRQWVKESHFTAFINSDMLKKIRDLIRCQMNHQTKYHYEIVNEVFDIIRNGGILGIIPNSFREYTLARFLDQVEYNRPESRIENPIIGMSYLDMILKLCEGIYRAKSARFVSN